MIVNDSLTIPVTIVNRVNKNIQVKLIADQLETAV